MDLLHVIGPICSETVDSFFPDFTECDNRKSKAPIVIRICSPGGESSSGLAIYDLIKTARHEVAIEAYGECSSVAMVILQAAKIRIAAPSCRALIHNGVLEVSDGRLVGAQLKAAVKELKRLDEFFHRLMAERTGLPFKEIQRLCCNETVLTAQEMLKMNFVDAILGQEKE